MWEIITSATRKEKEFKGLGKRNKTFFKFSDIKIVYAENAKNLEKRNKRLRDLVSLARS